ncbi:MAG: hypothetical protein QW474_02810 [Candidatus Aenigmatarchaeota archaeon]
MLFLSILIVVLILIFGLIISQKKDAEKNRNFIETIFSKKSTEQIVKEDLKNEIFLEINKLRTEKQLKELAFDDQVSRLSDKIVEEIAEKNSGLRNYINLDVSELKRIPLEKRLRNFEIENWKEAIEFYNAVTAVRKVSLIDNKPVEFKSKKEVIEELLINFYKNKNFIDAINDKEIDRIGIGYSSDNESINHFLAIILLKDTDCGYRNQKCCIEVGYLPYCYHDYKCIEDTCVKT